MNSHFEELQSIVRRLRVECPWDREQTHTSLRQGFIEETYESIEAIDAGDWNELCTELGDVMLHIVLQAAIAEEQHEFTMADVLTRISEKLRRRHPHVFGDAETPDTASQVRTWEKIKRSEGRTSIVDGVPKEMPALLRARRLQEKASKVGFDWNDRSLVWKKVAEETAELHEAVESGDQRHAEEEFGDLLFALVNYSRFLKIDPEQSLRETCTKFVKRFQYIEQRLREQGKDIDVTSLEEMDELWNEAKTKPGF
ncbi:MAG: nucleoside triphosphate pyrophosphohydrolase [Ignavibacteriales bacterium]|nr:nucleoside triphosphate pyrophosphohydrolase [Ignavibacteriales bacterium]